MRYWLEHAFITFVLMGCVTAPLGFAQPSKQATGSTTYCERPSLFDCPGGRRQAAREGGVDLDLWLTQFSQGITAGGGHKSWQYGGKGDLIINVDLAKAGLWRGLSLNAHQEWLYGEDANDPESGALFPFNTAMAFPRLGGGDQELTLTLSQSFGERGGISIGKFNMLDAAAKKPLTGGGGLNTFLNTALAAPITGVTPPYLFGVIGKLKAEHAGFTLMVYDPRNAQDYDVIRHPFRDGTTTSLSVTFPVTISGQKAFYGVRGVYSSKQGLDLATIPALIDLPEAAESILTKDGYWYLSTRVQQYLYHYPESPDIGWGLFAEGAISDGNPNPLKWHFIAGLGGQGLFPSRTQDHWGIGYFKYGLSDDLVRGLAKVGASMPFDPTFFIEDEEGLEAFYNLFVTPWLRITADLQRVHPHETSRDNATVGAVRVQLRF
ncbi:carbohydrate porin [Microbulbifer agarilyticus]|uniref:carbohydrate porin n=1 Tax=Microbulbifer agarilyticus TaxID=260552 RepID=UPI0009856CB6|nr:carbohydrate porin [Microbulbifer agarilyticus]